MENGTSDPKRGGPHEEILESTQDSTVLASGSAPASDGTAGAVQSVPGSTGRMAGAKLPKIIPFTELCRCGDEVWIEHDGQLYRLRRTRLGKLILTK